MSGSGSQLDQTELEFGDYGHDAAVTGVKRSGDTYEFQHGSIGDDKAGLLAEEDEASAAGSAAGWWSLEFYQRYFDVDTTQVLQRLLSASVPRGRNFVVEQLRPVPDLYGPFWVSTTLVFTMAICGNIAAYLGAAGEGRDLHWAYDFGMVTGSATAIAAYVALVPAAIAAWTWHRKLPEGYTYLETLSAYGYSLSVFVPVSVLWVAPWEGLRWGLIIVAVLLSGAVLASTFWPLLSGDANKTVAVGALVGLLALHALLAVGCKELFFASGTAVAHTAGPGPLLTSPKMPDVKITEKAPAEGAKATEKAQTEKTRRSPDQPKEQKAPASNDKVTQGGGTVSASAKVTGGG